MATTPSPLVWDFCRTIGHVDGVGGLVEYYDKSAQSVYLNGGDKKFATKTSKVDDGHWQDATWSGEEYISELAHGFLSLDHPSNGILYGVTNAGGAVYFVRYVYAMDIANLIDSGSYSSSNDNGISQLNMSVMNVSNELFDRDATLFQPGAKAVLKVRMGDSKPYDIGVAYMDEISFDPQSDKISLSGRNQTGYLLSEAKFGEHTTWTGMASDTAGSILELAGVKDYDIEPSNHVWTFTFDPDTTILNGLQTMFDFYHGWQLVELPSGKVIIGYPAWINSHYQATGNYVFEGGREIFKRKMSRNADAAYSQVYVTGKDLTPVVLDVNSFKFWNLPAQKIYFENAPDGLTQEELQSYAEDLAARLQYVGVTENYTSPFRPQLVVGDVAKVYYDDPEIATSIGTITSISHSFGKKGFTTQFSVDSGGDVTDGATRTKPLAGYTRRQNVVDLIKLLAKSI